MFRIFGGLSVLIYLIVIVFVIGFGEGCNRVGSSASEAVIDTVALTKHWEKAIPNQTVPEGMRNIRAEECGLCHTEIYKEWKRSIHSVALQDPQFQAEFKKDNVYVCLNCHTPLQNQQEFIVTGLINGDHKNPVKTPNPEFDPILKQESITCATCHVRNGTVIAAKGHPGSPHPVTVDPLFLSEQICLGCHNVTEVLNPALVCTFETGDEWMETSKKEQGFNCISCHMPIVKRAISEFGKEYDSHQHHFPGSGIPKFADMEIEGLQGLEIIEDKIKLNYQKEDTLVFELTLRNSYAGHSLPSGDPERFYLIDFKLVNSQGVIVDDDQFRIGEAWQWYPKAAKISDNNIKSGEQRQFHFKSGLTDTGQFNLVVEITKHRITKENAEYNKLPEDFPRYISIFNRTYPLLVDPL